jgi:hypothetical protein
VQTQRLGNCVDESEVGHRRGHNVAEVEADKVPVAQHGTVRRAANLQQDQEDEGDEEEEGGEQSGRLARAGGPLELGLCEFGVGLDGCGARVVGAAPPKERHGCAGVGESVGGVGVDVDVDVDETERRWTSTACAGARSQQTAKQYEMMKRPGQRSRTLVIRGVHAHAVPYFYGSMTFARSPRPYRMAAGAAATRKPLALFTGSINAAARANACQCHPPEPSLRPDASQRQAVGDVAPYCRTQRSSRIRNLLTCILHTAHCAPAPGAIFAGAGEIQSGFG